MVPYLGARSWALSLALLAGPVRAEAKLRVVTTTEDLAAIAREVAGEAAQVDFLVRGSQNPHFVEPRPGHILKLKRADLFVQVGLNLEAGWVPALLVSARNPKILEGSKGFLDASQGCRFERKLAARPEEMSMDLHPFANPHYWLDPENGRTIARSLSKRLSDLDPQHAKDYESGLARFESELARRAKKWDLVGSELKKAKAVAFHDAWSSFSARFGPVVINFIEPQPGVAPTRERLLFLEDQIQVEKARFILAEPYSDLKASRELAERSGAALVLLAPSVGSDPAVRTYLDLFDHNLLLLSEAAKGEPSRK